MAADTQELSFQNVVDTILKPEGIKVGGFIDDIFLDLKDADRDRWQCNICFLVPRDPKQCDNKHNFCATCIFAWSMTYGANSDKCPVCRHKQQQYLTNRKANTEIMQQWVKCPESGCALRCPLTDFMQHSHGIKLYGVTPQLDRLRRPRPDPVTPLLSSSLVMLPTLRGARHPVTQGRNLLQDMMLVLHMEVELRRRAIERFHLDSDADQRERHFNEVIAIQSQMQEITSFLDVMLRLPSSTGRGPMLLRPQETVSTSARSRVWSDVDDSSDSDTSTDSVHESSESTTVPHPPTQPAPQAVRRTSAANSTNPAGTCISNVVSNNNVANSPMENTSDTTSDTEVVPAVTSNQLADPTSPTRRQTAVTARNVEEETITVLSTLNQLNGNSSTNNNNMLPRGSSAYQTVRGQLPPVAGAEREERQSNLTGEHSSQSDSQTSMRSRSQMSPNTGTRFNPSPGLTTAPHRRPVPPADSGSRLNVRPRQTRRRMSVSNNTASSTNNNNRSSTLAANTSTSATQSQAASSRRLARHRLVAVNGPSANRPTANRTNGGNVSSLPGTSGALLRARRRSEIQQQLLNTTASRSDSPAESSS